MVFLNYFWNVVTFLVEKKNSCDKYFFPFTLIKCFLFFVVVFQCTSLTVLERENYFIIRCLNHAYFNRAYLSVPELKHVFNYKSMIYNIMHCFSICRMGCHHWRSLMFSMVTLWTEARIQLRFCLFYFPSCWSILEWFILIEEITRIT